MINLEDKIYCKVLLFIESSKKEVLMQDSECTVNVIPVCEGDGCTTSNDDVQQP